MVDKKQIKHIADLAKLDLKKEKEDDLLEEVASILDYMEVLEEVDVTGIEAMGHVHENENILKNDRVKEASEDIKKGILDSAPETKDNYFKVDTILNKEEE